MRIIPSFLWAPRSLFRLHRTRWLMGDGGHPVTPGMRRAMAGEWRSDAPYRKGTRVIARPTGTDRERVMRALRRHAWRNRVREVRMRRFNRHLAEGLHELSLGMRRLGEATRGTSDAVADFVLDHLDGGE